MRSNAIVTIMASLVLMGGEVCWSALQSLELLIIDNDKLLQPIMLDHIITISLHHPLDKGIALLVSKILGCYANNDEVCIFSQAICLYCNHRGWDY